MPANTIFRQPTESRGPVTPDHDFDQQMILAYARFGVIEGADRLRDQLIASQDPGQAEVSADVASQRQAAAEARAGPRPNPVAYQRAMAALIGSVGTEGQTELGEALDRRLRQEGLPRVAAIVAEIRRSEEWLDFRLNECVERRGQLEAGTSPTQGNRPGARPSQHYAAPEVDRGTGR